MIKYLRYKYLLFKRKKILKRIQNRCPHNRSDFVKNKTWHKSMWGETSSMHETWNGDIYRCYKCGKEIRHNVKCLESTFSRYGKGRVSTTTNYVTGEVTKDFS